MYLVDDAVGHSNKCVNFELNYKRTLYTKNDFAEQRRWMRIGRIKYLYLRGSIMFHY